METRSISEVVDSETVMGTAVACQTDDDCRQAASTTQEEMEVLWQCSGGQCKKGNPLERGCFISRSTGWTKKRVCNSEDALEAELFGICRRQNKYEAYYNSYGEVRIHVQNWETSVFEAWLLQIILSEMLDVPTTIETGNPSGKLNLYDHDNLFQEIGLSVNGNYDALSLAQKLGGDCRLAKRGSSRNAYQACAHIIPEVWAPDNPVVQAMVRNDVLFPTQGLGVVGQSSWYVPKFTAQRDWSILNYMALQGQENRLKLAETFLRPTTWRDYCDQVSVNNCTTDDGIAARAPFDEIENERMFVERLYTGHFRKTEKNDCNRWPLNCTGHIADFPCGWGGNLKQQTYHLDIALESNGPFPNSGGYTYDQLIEMWLAANATKSNLMMNWYNVDPTYQEFIGTSAEFTRVILPPSTQKCIEARVTQEDRCSDDFQKQIGDHEGACEDPLVPLQIVISTSLLQFSENEYSRDVLVSPAFDAVRNFKISNEQIGDLLHNWKNLSSPREAVCAWAVDNIGLLEGYLPDSWPRVFEMTRDEGPLYVASITTAITTLALVLCTTVQALRMRKRRLIKHAQLDFLLFMLLGLCCVSIGAVLTTVSTANVSCVATVWFINFGYTFELVPLIVKVGAINRMAHAAKKLRHLIIDRRYLYTATAAISAFLFAFLSVWTAVDAPSSRPAFTLTDELTPHHETVVLVTYHCRSNSSVWEYISVVWISIILISGAMLAFFSRNTGGMFGFNEAPLVGLMVYCHLFFVLLRLVTIVLETTSPGSRFVLQSLRSLVFSVDTILTLLIYFLPKFFRSNYGKNSMESKFMPSPRLPEGLDSRSVPVSWKAAAVTQSEPIIWKTTIPDVVRVDPFHQPSHGQRRRLHSL